LGLNRSPDGLVVVAAAYRDFITGITHVEIASVRDQMTNMGEAIDWLTANTHRRVPVVWMGSRLRLPSLPSSSEAPAHDNY
jgi:hypothetical protein